MRNVPYTDAIELVIELLCVPVLLAASLATTTYGQEASTTREVAAPPAPDARGGPARTSDRRLNPDNLGLNYPWVDDHQGHVQMQWMQDYPSELVEDDLKVISQLGVRIIRVFAPVDAVMSFDGEQFALEPRRAEHVDRFLESVGRRGLKVILVMADGNANERPENLAGKFRWDLVQSERGLSILSAAYATYVRRFRKHAHVLMWEVANEPYGNLTWAAFPQERHVSVEETHRYLRTVYQSVKPLTSAYVGFSDLHEEQQEKYRLFSNPEFRRRYIDDATDVYAMHIYRASPDQVPDFSELRGKPKWCSELGSYNYVDETGTTHAGQPARGELWNERENFQAVTTILPKLLDGGFELILPWAFTANEGLVVHRRDGSHELKALPLWMQAQLSSVAGRAP
jgi:hypothetical protein